LTTPLPSGGDLLARGLAAFCDGRFFEAHEDWEKVWRRASGNERRWLQGLIQLAAAGVHLRKGRPGPARKLLVSGIEKLENAPESFLGIPAATLLALALSLQSDLVADRVPADPAILFRLPEPRRTA
jgi:predicted metal-dependent hydrolase